MSPRKQLVVNADDFGFTPDVNEGIVEAHRDGILTATTLMANGAAFEDAVRLARQTPTLDVGCHLVLVSGSSPLTGKPYPLTVARLAEEFGIRWVRRPFDLPLTTLKGTVPMVKRMTSGSLGFLRSRFHRVLERHGCRTTGHFAGFQMTGRLRTAELVELLGMLPAGSTELMVHPGRCREPLRQARTRLKESREWELEALLAPETRQALQRHAIELVNYSGFTLE